MNTSVTCWQQLTSPCHSVAEPCLPSLLVCLRLTKSGRNSHRLRSNNTAKQAGTRLASHRNRIKGNVANKELVGLWPLIFKSWKPRGFDRKAPSTLCNLNLYYCPFVFTLLCTLGISWTQLFALITLYVFCPTSELWLNIKPIGLSMLCDWSSVPDPVSKTN